MNGRSSLNWTRHRHPIRCLALAMLAIALGACGGLLESDEPPDSTWWLEPTSLGAKSEAPRPLVVSVSVVPGLDTDQVLNLNDQGRLNHYAGAHWAEHTPELIDSLLRRGLEAGGAFAPIRSGDHARSGECLLDLEVRAFFGRLDGDGSTRSVEVELAGEMNCGSERTPVSAKVRESVSDNRMSLIVAAFQRALDDSLESVASAMQGQ